MKTLILAAAAALVSTAALAQEAPIYIGDYSASTASQFDASSEDLGRFTFSFSSSASATNTDERTGQTGYGPTVDAFDIYSGR